MLHFFKTLASLIPNAKAGKLRLYADDSEIWRTKNALGEVRTLGNAVRSITKIGTDVLVDTYLVVTDDFSFNIEVTNGRGIANIEPPANAGQPDSTDTYTVRYNNGDTSTFIVRNGRDGVDGLVLSVNGISQPNIILTAADVGAIPAAELGLSVAQLVNGTVPAAQLPAFVDDVLEFANLAAFPATGESGKIYVAINDGKTYRWSGSQYIEISAAPVTQVNGKVGNVTLSTTDIGEGTNLYFTAQRVRDTLLTGLSLATNAAIAAGDSVLSAFGKLQKQLTDHFESADPHPIYTTNAEATTIANQSVATHVGLADPHAQYILESEKGAANGVATLGTDQKIPAIQLPSYVDDVLEFANLSAFPGTGEAGKIYVALDTNKTYRWSGTSYIEISPSPGSTDGVAEGTTNLYFTAQRVRDTLLTGLSLTTNAAIAAGDSVLSALGKLQKQITDDIAALASHTGNTNNPHNTTAAQVGADSAGTAAQAISTHEQAADPHPQYLTTTEAQALIPPNKLSAKITALFTSAANSTAVQIVLSLAIPSGYLTTGKSFDFDLEGTQSQSAAATNVVGAIFVNNTQLVSAAVAGGTAAQTNRSIRLKGGIMWNGAKYLGNITTGISGVLPVGNANVTGVAVAAATAHNIDIRVQTSTANAANIIRAMVAAIKEI